MQAVEKKRKRDERKAAQKLLHAQSAENDGTRVLVRNSATGEVIAGDAAPHVDELDAWLDSHPGYEALARNGIESDSEEEDDKDETHQPAADSADMEDELAGRCRCLAERKVETYERVAAQYSEIRS